MILGFKQYFPWGEPTFFEQKIILSAGLVKSNGMMLNVQPGDIVDLKLGDFFIKDLQPKLHTIRAGFRWKAGDRLHMATGVRTKQYDQFNTNIPGLQVVKSVQIVNIFTKLKAVSIAEWNTDKGVWQYSGINVDTLLVNDGFTSQEQFWKFFDKESEGQIIHWTDLKY